MATTDPLLSGGDLSDHTIPPSPTPPWARPVLSPQTQNLTGDPNATNAIVLTMDTTYLLNPPPPTVGPFPVTLPAGNYRRQYKTILVPQASNPLSGAFVVTGTFAGFTSLTFDTLGQSAVLTWDGTAWHLIGGNATPNP